MRDDLHHPVDQSARLVRRAAGAYSARGFTTVALTLADDAVPVEDAVAGLDRVARWSWAPRAMACPPRWEPTAADRRARSSGDARGHRLAGASRPARTGWPRLRHHPAGPRSSRSVTRRAAAPDRPVAGIAVGRLSRGPSPASSAAGWRASRPDAVPRYGSVSCCRHRASSFITAELKQHPVEPSTAPPAGGREAVASVGPDCRNSPIAIAEPGERNDEQQEDEAGAKHRAALACTCPARSAALLAAWRASASTESLFVVAIILRDLCSKMVAGLQLSFVQFVCAPCCEDLVRQPRYAL